MILDVFFRGEKVPVRHWEEGDPVQEAGNGCGPFAFLIMCSLALGQRLHGWTSKDEGVAKNYLWACLIKGAILPLPRYKLL